MDHRIARVLGVATPWLVGASLVLVALDWVGEGQAVPLVLTLLLGAGQGVALRWRYRRPEPTLALVIAMAVGYHLLVPEAVVPLAPMVALWAVARAMPPRRSLVGLAGVLAACAVNFALVPAGDAAFTMAVAACVWALAEASRSRREAIRETAMRATRDEQARIARELHDVIAHSVTVMVVQAAAAGDVFDQRPDSARAALTTIEEVGRDTLGELRRLLGGVRSDDATSPQPGLERIEDLAGAVRSAGLDVRLVEHGTPSVVPAGVDVSAYRIVQEALTNTLRHARATAAHVTVSYSSDAVEIDVLDDGRAAPPRPSGGYGLVGMRERAALLGGTLEAGPTGHGGFRVRAHLPFATPT